jgi:LysM repeat protein
MLALLLILGVLAITSTVTAQDGNLLQQSGFDDGYTGRGRSDLNIPGAWGLWLADAPRDYEWQNRTDHVFAFPHRPSPEKRSGDAALNISGGYITFAAAVFQQVGVTQGSNVEGSAWARLHTCNLPRNDKHEINGDNCGSAVESGAFTKVGIDPNGGTDPNDTDIVWSANARPHDRYDQMVVSATATGPVVTIFLYTTQTSPSDLNNVYWDDASLVIGGAGGAAAGAPGAPTVPPIRPTNPVPVRQAERADGSIVHIVQPGDTIDGIAMIYGVSRAQILELNVLDNPRFIRIGDRIIVRSAG